MVPGQSADCFSVAVASGIVYRRKLFRCKRWRTLRLISDSPRPAPGLVLESGAYDRLVPVFLRPQGSGNVNTRPHDAPALVVQADNWLHNAHAALLGCWRSAVSVQGV